MLKNEKKLCEQKTALCSSKYLEACGSIIPGTLTPNFERVINSDTNTTPANKTPEQPNPITVIIESEHAPPSQTPLYPTLGEHLNTQTQQNPMNDENTLLTDKLPETKQSENNTEQNMSPELIHTAQTETYDSTQQDNNNQEVNPSPIIPLNQQTEIL